MRRYTFEILLALILTLFLIGIWYIGQGIKQFAEDRKLLQEQRMEQVKTDWRPNIRHCFSEDDNIGLWDCIRDEKAHHLPSPHRGRGFAHNEVGELGGVEARPAQVLEGA